MKKGKNIIMYQVYKEVYNPGKKNKKMTYTKLVSRVIKSIIIYQILNGISIINTFLFVRRQAM